MKETWPVRLRRLGTRVKTRLLYTDLFCYPPHTEESLLAHRGGVDLWWGLEHGGIGVSWTTEFWNIYDAEEKQITGRDWDVSLRLNLFWLHLSLWRIGPRLYRQDQEDAARPVRTYHLEDLYHEGEDPFAAESAPEAAQPAHD